MANTPTTNHGLLKPTYQDTRWDIPSNTNLDNIDALVPPKGGASGQVLSKASSGDNDYAWTDASGGSGGTGLAPKIIANAPYTGNIYGGSFYIDPYGSFELKPFSCLSDDGLHQIYSEDSIWNGFGGYEPMYYIFAALWDDGSATAYADTNPNGANIVDPPKVLVGKRLLFFGTASGSTSMPPCASSGDWISYTQASRMQLPGDVTTTWSTIDHSSIIPVDRVELIKYGVYYKSGTNGVVSCTVEPNNNYYLESIIGKPSAALAGDNDNEAWGIPGNGEAAWLPFDVNRQFKSADGVAGLQIHGIKMKR